MLTDAAETCKSIPPPTHTHTHWRSEIKMNCSMERRITQLSTTDSDRIIQSPERPYRSL